MKQIKKIKVDDILIEDRLRDIDGNFATAIAASIKERGQDNAIIVRQTNAGKKPYTLVDGAHRMAAFKILKMPEIEAVVQSLDKDNARLVEIDTALMRSELNALDRAVFLAERKQVHERLHPQTKHGGDRKSEAAKNQNDTHVGLIGNEVLNFSKETAEKLGLTVRSIERAVMIAKKLSPATRKALHGTPAANNQSQLLKLASLDKKAQSVAIGIFKENDNLGDAINQAGGGKALKKKPDADMKYEALVAAWKHAPKVAKENFLSLLGDEVQEILEGLK